MKLLRAKAVPMVGMVVCASLPLAAQSAVYKCVEEGRVVFADRPCAYVHPSGPQAAPQPPAARALRTEVPPPAELRPARR
ncbi:MAG: DUF4124 domain-containing protein [Zoogloea sp.]|nr:DUF4124 domain-containing protein [Zoogloea sp.]